MQQHLHHSTESHTLPGALLSGSEQCWSYMMVTMVPFLPLLLNTAGCFKPCPSHCLCYESSDLVDCRARGLDRVPGGVPHSTWLLELSGNKLTEVRTRSFIGLWSLKVLLMSNNSIHILHPQSLSPLQFLERLDLSFNRLRWLPRDFSQRLSSLQELRLDHNLLQYLDTPSLDHFENLRKLDLSYNQISGIESRAFHCLSRLTQLKLKGNKLNVLKENLFSQQQSLEVLLLSHNNISLIESEALAPLRSLSLLDLQGNQLEHIKFRAFLMLQTTSTHLEMSFNPWICDCELQRVFSKIQHVRHLHVEDYQNIVCHAPAQQAGSSLSSLDSQLCMAETVSVLVITITVLLAVIGALVKAEHNTKQRHPAVDSDSQRQRK
ncbi:leucine-rich repeat-containing protein 17 [Thalassophryne amazonica]|uniref:leucine-rich repeat-containing protein 17 n=1 Tax=Thalassophryne amazonica TaxID=390379 RepID=UPI0014709E20|nr:leucine-rich repeat-containing protein 17 [Thalassophryne amazonica]